MKTNLNTSLILYDSRIELDKVHDDKTLKINVKQSKVFSFMQDFAVAADIVEGKFQKLTRQKLIMGRVKAEIYSNILTDVVSGDFYKVVYFEAIKQFCIQSNLHSDRINLNKPPNLCFIVPVLPKSSSPMLARVNVLPYERDQNGKLISIYIFFHIGRKYDNSPLPVHPRVFRASLDGEDELGDWIFQIKNKMATSIMEWLDLTEDEWDVLEYLLEDKTRAEIADMMKCSAGKVRNLCRSIKRKAAKKISPIFNQGRKSQAKDVAVFLKEMWVLGTKKQRPENY